MEHADHSWTHIPRVGQYREFSGQRDNQGVMLQCLKALCASLLFPWRAPSSMQFASATMQPRLSMASGQNLWPSGQSIHLAVWFLKNSMNLSGSSIIAVQKPPAFSRKARALRALPHEEPLSKHQSSSQGSQWSTQVPLQAFLSARNKIPMLTCKRNETIYLGNINFHVDWKSLGLESSHWLCFNPFTPKSDQSQISPAASPEILHHTAYE